MDIIIKTLTITDKGLIYKASNKCPSTNNIVDLTPPHPGQGIPVAFLKRQTGFIEVE